MAVRIPSLDCRVQTVVFPKSYCLLKSLFTSHSKSLQEILCWRKKFDIFVSHLASLLCGVSRAGCDQVACPCVAKCLFFFHHLKKSSFLHCAAPGIKACPPGDWREFGRFPGHITLAHVIFTAAPIIRWDVSLRHRTKINQEDVFCPLCLHILCAGIAPRSKGLLLRWACLCSVPDLICCIY